MLLMFVIRDFREVRFQSFGANDVNDTHGKYTDDSSMLIVLILICFMLKLIHRGEGVLDASTLKRDVDRLVRVVAVLKIMEVNGNSS